MVSTIICNDLIKEDLQTFQYASRKTSGKMTNKNKNTENDDFVHVDVLARISGLYKEFQ